MSEFKYPVVEENTPVIHYDNPDGNNGRLGFVTKAKTESADVLVFTGSGIVEKHDCWHIGDPRCEDMKASISAPDRGVFRISPKEIRERELRAACEVAVKFAESQNLMAEKTDDLTHRIAKLETKLLAPPQPRGPGRPRKEDLQEVT